MSLVFLEDFSGAGTLNGRTPSIGGTYTVDLVDSGDLTLMVLDGSGALLMGTYTGHAASLLTAPLNGSYVLEYIFLVNVAVPTAYASVDAHIADGATGQNLAGVFIGQNDPTYSTWTFNVEVYNLAGSPLYVTAIPFTPTGSNQTVRIEGSPTGIVFKLDGAVQASTALVPDVYADTVSFAIQRTSDLTADGKLEQVSVDLTPPPPAVSTSFNTLRPRIFAPG